MYVMNCCCCCNWVVIYRMKILSLKIQNEVEQHRMLLTSDQRIESLQAWQEQKQLILKLTDEVVKLEQNGGFRAAGFFFINRGTVTAILGTIMTYLIIMMTWPGSEDDYIPDYVKDVCCHAFNHISEEELDLYNSWVINQIYRI